MADIFTSTVPTGLGGCGVAGCYKYIAPDGAAAAFPTPAPYKHAKGYDFLMNSNNHLVDYYEYLQVGPNADAETIEKVFRMLAKRYHPDNPVSGNLEKFDMILEAYRVLSDPEKRASYDITYPEIQRRKWQFHMSISSEDNEQDETKIRYDILAALYVMRRKNVKDPGIGIWHMEKLLGYPEELMEFEMWYLKEKGWLLRTDTGKFAITADGVDVVEKNKLVSNNIKLLPLPEHMNGN